MPKNVVSFRFTDGVNAYVSDLNINYSIASRFNAPPDIDGIAAAAIVTAAGGVITNEPVVCSDGDSIYPRKLQFIRASGNTVSVAIGKQTDLVAAATAIKGILDGGTSPVVCIKLMGEKAKNLNDELGVVYDGTTFATTHKAPAGALKQNYVSGVFSYESDIGGTVLQPIRSITENSDNSFAAQLGGTPADCGLTVLDVVSCPNGKRNPREHRRFHLDFAVAGEGDSPEQEKIQLPVSGSGALDILACANSAAALSGLFCIGYTGENYDRFHKLLA